MTMNITLTPNALYSQPQTLTVDKVATLIGENGSGKSCILHSIFDSKLSNRGLEDLRVVCFSSGQNENFSKNFSRFLNQQRRRGESLSLECFYYDKSWSKLLIFLATSLHSNGQVRDFLRQGGYVDEAEISATQRDDTTTRLEIKFKIDKRYVERVQDALRQETSGVVDTLRATPYFRSLTNFISNVVDADYDFEDVLRKRAVTLGSDSLLSVSYISDIPDEDEVHPERIRVQENPTVSFYTQAADNNYFIDRDSLKLTLKDDLELDQLSDGEYQLLFLYALVDLFDAENTLFLLDEADSHLHYQNVERLWEILKGIDGTAITTTHLLDSITANDFSAIKVVENGCIRDDDKVRQLINRLSVLSRASTVEFKVCAKVANMALLDDFNDWEIFLRLAERKGLDIARLSSVYAFKKTSNYETVNTPFAKAKLEWVETLSKVDEALESRQIFLICDKDNAELQFDDQTGVKVCGQVYRRQIRAIDWPHGLNVSVHLLAWKRREIKNYLLSHTALNHHGILHEINGNGDLGENHHLLPHDSADNDGIRRLNAKPVVDPLINGEHGFCKEKLQAYIDLIPPEEISEDIENMYNYIIGKLN